MNLSRFLNAQEKDYQRALAEIRSGKKRSHWMWYIFPQLAGLGLSAMSQQYAIKDLNEADQYLGILFWGVDWLKFAKRCFNFLVTMPTQFSAATMMSSSGRA